MSIFGWLIQTREPFGRSLRELRSVRTVVLLGLLTALQVAVASFEIVLTPWLRIRFGFVFHAAGGMLFGPAAAALQGVAADLVGFLMRPGEQFFPGYTLSAVLSGVVYGLFLYRVRVTWSRALACKATVNLFINIGLGTLWSAMLYGKGFWALLAARGPKNLAMLIVEVPLLLITYRLLQRAERRAR